MMNSIPHFHHAINFQIRSFKDIYLLFYNYLACYLWIIGLCYNILSQYSKYSQNKYLTIVMHDYDVVRYFIGIQLIMVIDVLNASFKIIKTSVIATLLQIASRYYVVILLYVELLDYKNKYEYQQEWNTILMFCSWSIAEIIRYGYYLHKNSKLIKWLRYNAFIINYPIGVILGELVTIWNFYKQSNFKAHHCAVIMIIYIPCFPYLYLHMLQQRRKNCQHKHNQNKND